MDRDYLLFFEGETEMKVPSELNLQCGFSVTSYLFITELKSHMTCYNSMPLTLPADMFGRSEFWL